MVNGDAASIKPLIVETALAHHLVSKYTSLVAVDVTPTLPPGVASESTLIPVNLPAGSDAELGGLPQTATPAPLLLAVGTLALAIALCAALAMRRQRRGGRALRDRVTAARLVC